MRVSDLFLIAVVGLTANFVIANDNLDESKAIAKMRLLGEIRCLAARRVNSSNSLAKRPSGRRARSMKKRTPHRSNGTADRQIWCKHYVAATNAMCGIENELLVLQTSCLLNRLRNTIGTGMAR